MVKKSSFVAGELWSFQVEPRSSPGVDTRSWEMKNGTRVMDTQVLKVKPKQWWRSRQGLRNAQKLSTWSRAILANLVLGNRVIRANWALKIAGMAWQRVPKAVVGNSMVSTEELSVESIVDQDLSTWNRVIRANWALGTASMAKGTKRSGWELDGLYWRVISGINSRSGYESPGLRSNAKCKVLGKPKPW